MTSVAYTMYLNALQTNLSRVHTQHVITLIGRRLIFMRWVFVIQLLLDEILAQVLNKIFGKKKQRKIGNLIYDHNMTS